MIIFVSIVLFEWFGGKFQYVFSSPDAFHPKAPSGACLYWQNGYCFFKVMTNGFKRGLEENFSPASELGSFPAFGKSAFKRHSHSRDPAVQVFVLLLVIVFSDSPGMETISF